MDVQNNQGRYEVKNEIPSGTVDGSNTDFYLAYQPIAGTVRVKGGYTKQAADFRAALDGDITADQTGRMLGIARAAGTIHAVVIGLQNTGADPSNPLSIEVDIKKNGTSIFDSGTTKPTLSKADPDYATDRVVLGAADTDSIAADDVLTYDATITRTASPTDEMAGLAVQVEMEPDAEQKREGASYDFTVDEKNCKITFATAPPVGAEIYVSYEHYNVKK